MNRKESKHIVFLLWLGCCFLGLMSMVVHQEEQAVHQALQPILTVAVYQEQSGKSLKQIMAEQALPRTKNKQQLKRYFQQQAKRQKKLARKQQKLQNNPPPMYGEKSQLTAFLLCVLLGIFGAHRFYTGQAGWGILQLCSLGCCGVFVIIDMIFIIIGKLKTKDGADLIPW